MLQKTVIGALGAVLFLASCTAPTPSPTVAPTPVPETPEPAITPTIDLSFLSDLSGSIAFLSDRSGVPNVYVMTPDGQDIRRLSDLEVGRRLAWSPDGQRLVFTEMTIVEDGPLGNLFIISADGTGLTQLTDVLALRAYFGARSDIEVPPGKVAFASAWSPDGTKIAFNLESRAFVVDSDGSDPQDFSGYCECAGMAWSPDETQTAFGDVFTGRLWIADAQGRDPQLLAVTRNPELDSDELATLTYILSYDVPNPRWSPDGTRLAFVSLIDGNPEIYIINRDGTGLQRLTFHSALDLGPVWSPDGEFLAFFSNRTGNFDIYIYRLADSLVVNLTNHLAQDLDPAWSPAPLSPDLPTAG